MGPSGFIRQISSDHASLAEASCSAIAPWCYSATEPSGAPGELCLLEGDPLPKCATELHCESICEVPYEGPLEITRGREPFDATFFPSCLQS